MQAAIKDRIKQAVEDHAEVDIILDGGTGFPNLVAEGEIDAGVYAFESHDGTTFLIEEGMVRGVGVAATPPTWYTRREKLQEQFNQNG